MNLNIAELTQSSQAMKDYTMLQIVGVFVSSLWQIGLAFAFLQTGIAAHLARLVERDSQMQFLRAATYFLFFFVYLFVLSLPIKVLLEYCPDRAYDLSANTSFSYIVKKCLDFIVNLITMLPIFALGMEFAKRFPRHWGYCAGIMLAVVAAFQMVFLPAVLEDNSAYLKPLGKPDVQARVEAIFKKAGLDGAKVLVENVPETKKLNAYATGAGPTSRFILYESVINTLSAEEIESMIAHEISHIKLNHLMLNVFFTCVFLFLAPVSAQYLAPFLIQRLPEKWGIKTIADLPVIALVVLIVLAGNFLSLPVQNYFSRQFERQADAQALALTGNPEAFARQLAQFARANLDDMDPPGWAVLTLYSHPSVKERIETALKSSSDYRDHIYVEDRNRHQP